MKKNLLLFSIMFISNFLIAQSFDIIHDQKDVNVHLSGFLNSGTNTIGSSLLYFHRNNDAEHGLLKWNLNKSYDLYEEIDETDDQDYWEAGISGNDDFKISKYIYRYYSAVGGVEESANAMVIKDTYSGINHGIDIKVIFPEGHVEIGNGNKIRGISAGVIYIEDADLRPYDCGQDLGTSSIPWSDVYAQDFYDVNGCLGLWEGSTKSGFSALGAIANIQSYYGHNEKSSDHRFYLDPRELIKVVPEAVGVFENEHLEKSSATAEDTFYGINYNQLIPVLIQAIQEQQKQIDELTHKLESE